MTWLRIVSLQDVFSRTQSNPQDIIRIKIDIIENKRIPSLPSNQLKTPIRDSHSTFFISLPYILVKLLVNQIEIKWEKNMVSAEVGKIFF